MGNRRLTPYHAVMVYTPVELTKDGKTEVAETISEEARLRWDGWLPTDTPVVIPIFDDRVRDLVEDADSATAMALAIAFTTQLKPRDMLNVLDHGVVRGTTSSQTAAIKAALDANPGKAFYFPPGDYRLNTTLLITSNNSIFLAAGARLYAGASMTTLVDYDNGTVGANTFTADQGIVGLGILDGNLLATNVLAIGAVLRFTLDGLTIANPVRRGLVTKVLGAEILARNLRIHNTGTTNSHTPVTVSTTSGSAAIVATAGTFSAADVGFPVWGPGIPAGAVVQTFTDATHVTLSVNATATATGVAAAVITSIAIDAAMGDCHWTDVIIRDFTIGVWDKGSNLWTSIHPWIGTTAQITARYQYSVAFLLSSDSKLMQPTSDTYRYAFRTASTGGFARARLVLPRAMANTGQLTNALAASYPGVVFDIQDAGRVISLAGSWQGHGVTPFAFVAGNSAQLVARNNLETSAGSVTGVAEYHRGVKMGVSSFSGTLFGSTSGSVTLTTNDCKMEVRDGFVLYSFILVGTASADLAGKLRVGGLPLPSGAVSTSTGMGTVSFVTGPDVNVTIGANGTTGPLVARLQRVSGGATVEPDVNALAGQSIQVWGQIACSFAYPS